MGGKPAVFARQNLAVSANFSVLGPGRDAFSSVFPRFVPPIRAAARRFTKNSAALTAVAGKKGVFPVFWKRRNYFSPLALFQPKSTRCPW